MFVVISGGARGGGGERDGSGGPQVTNHSHGKLAHVFFPRSDSTPPVVVSPVGVKRPVSSISPQEMEPPFKPDDILEPTVDTAEWNLELERVLPQLKVTIRTDNKVLANLSASSG